MRTIVFLTLLASAGTIDRDVVINAPVSEVWKMWTTEGGARAFFAPLAKIELRPGGAYEMYFNPGEQPGLRGGEGNQGVAFEAERFLLVTWNAPPKFGALRDVRTFVAIRFEPMGAARTRIFFTHFGFREGAEWSAIHAYFERAWDAVFAQLITTFQR